MIKLAIINIFLKVLDLGTTYYYVNIHGTIKEANPIMRFIYNNAGLFWGSVSIFMLYALLIYILCQKRSLVTMYIAFAIMSFTVINNFYHIFAG